MALTAPLGARGKVLSVSSSSKLNNKDLHTETKSTSYDTLGRPTQTLTNISTRGEYTSSLTYDTNSRPLTLTYPNGYEVTNHYREPLKIPHK